METNEQEMVSQFGLLYPTFLPVDDSFGVLGFNMMVIDNTEILTNTIILSQP